MLRVTIKVFET